MGASRKSQVVARTRLFPVSRDFDCVGDKEDSLTYLVLIVVGGISVNSNHCLTTDTTFEPAARHLKYRHELSGQGQLGRIAAWRLDTGSLSAYTACGMPGL